MVELTMAMQKMRLVGFLGLSFLLGVLLSCEKVDEKKASVDFRDRIHPKEGVPSGQVQPIRIAVAAMVSPKETASYYDAMMKYVSKRLGRPIELIQKKTYQEVNDMLERKELDLAFVCAGPYVSGHKKFGMELLAAPMLYGKAFYQGYFIVHKDSPIKGIEGLRGKRFAFTDPASNTGRLVPTYELARMGETPERFFKEVVYTYSHDNSIKAVSKGLVDGASVDGLIWDFYNDKNPAMVRETKVIYASPFYGIPPVVVHPQASPLMKEQMRKVFLDMHQDAEGLKILTEIRIERFILPDDASYDSVRKMQDWIEKKR